MIPIQFAQTPAAVLNDSATMASASVPRYSPLMRARIASRLRALVAGGRVRATDVREAFRLGVQGSDSAIVRVGETLVQRQLARLQVHRVPIARLKTLRSPEYDSKENRDELRQWLIPMVRGGHVAPERIASSVRADGNKMAQLLRDGVTQMRASVLEAMCDRIGLPAADRPRDFAWAVGPNFHAKPLDGDKAPGQITLYPDQRNVFGFTLTWLDATDQTPGLLSLCAALAQAPLRVIQLCLPHELASEGFAGGMFYEEVEAFARRMDFKNGRPVLTEDFEDQLSAEFGISMDGEEGQREKILRLLTFKHEQARLIPKVKSVAQAQTLLVRTASGASRKGGAVLKRIAALLAELDPGAHKRLNLEVSALDDESMSYAMHAVHADLSGYEHSAISDMHECNGNVGACGGILIRGDDRYATLGLALREVCFITLLDHLLHAYMSAIA